VSSTALGTAAGRALESFRSSEDRLFEDRFALDFLPAVYRLAVLVLRAPLLGPALLAARERQIPGITGNLLCRTRFIDDAFRDAVAGGCEQIVILGAGLDSRAYRISEAQRARVVEVDHPATQAWKRDRVERLHGGVPSHVTFVPIDFDRQRLGEAMAGATLDASVRTLFVWEGVTQYISAEAVDSTLRYVSGTAPAGSRLVFTYIDRAIIEGSGGAGEARKLLEEVARHGEPWRFGIDPAELREFLSDRGLRLIEDVGAPEYRARYLAPTGREMDLFEGERVAVAQVTGGDGSSASAREREFEHGVS
jgi:methyltransferase (TIGR00027 family)